MAPTLTPMKTTSRSFLFGGGRTVVKRKGHRSTTSTAQPRSNETEETKTIVFTEGFTETSPFPNNNNDSGMSSGGGKTPMRREANSRSGGGNKMIQLKRRPAINIKNKRRLDDDEDYELFDLQANKDNDDYSKEEDSSPGSRAGQSLAEDDSSTYSNASEESSDNEWNDDEILQNTDDEDTDDDEEEENDLLDNNNGQWLGMNNNNYDEEDDSSVEQENNQREIWDLKQVLTVKQIYQPGPIKCQTEKCRLIACCIWSSNLDPNTPWYTCLDCQEKDFKGWPAEGELPLKVFPNELRNAMMDRCTKYRKYSSKKRIKPSMPDWLPTGEEELEDEEEENVSQQFTTMTQYTTQFMDGEEDNGGTPSDTNSEAGSVDSEAAREDQVASMLENVLGSGIASVCRLRKLFPIHFFEKMDFGGTTVTRFDKNVLKAICNDDPYWSEDEDDDDKSMVSSFKAQTQKSLSPLTEYTQKNRKVAAARSNAHDHVGYSDQEKRLASEALLILRWTQNEGVGSILREGNLASVIFGISVPSEEDSSSSGELIESYSFNISYNKPDYPEEVDTEEVMDTTGSFFQNLNGFQAGNRSLSQAVVPCKTQGTQYTQASRGATSQYPTQTQSVDFSIPLSQKHTQASKSQMLTSMSQSQMMASMSQSIRVSVKKNQGNKIPTSRYLTLRVDFTALLKSKELPQALKQGKSSRRSPIPIAAVQPNAKETKDGFVVTPLGRITENGHSGLCVDMFAETKCSEAKDKENNDGSDDDDRSDNHSQKSYSPANSQSNKDDDSPLTDHSEKDLSENDENDTDAQKHFTQHEKDETSSHDDDGEASPNESASVDEATATQIVNEQCEAEENTSIQVDAKAFGIPFGLGLDNDTYVQCEIREQRTTQLKDDLEVEEFKCCFDSDELEKAGMKKQWIPKTRLVSYNEMFQNVQFYLQFKESKGDDTTSSSIIEEVAQNVRVDPAFVGMLAKKRKTAQDEREERMKRARR